ncbi:MBL fold metallo-hydrolase [Chloroflexota bacterium]
MFEEILPDLYRIEIPLPRNPLQSLNSYLIKGDGRFLIIDTGLNRDECRDAMLSALEELHVDLASTSFFITHIHADHSGLLTTLASENSIVYFNQKESVMIDSGGLWEGFNMFFLSHGFPEEELAKAMDSHPGRRYGLKRHFDFTVVNEGDPIEIGDYCFKCVSTPGHSPGHMSLYEANKNILIAGDHILFDITPNIGFWPNMEDALTQYLASLEKVYQLDVSIVLPGHRNILNDHKTRIKELQEHHHDRLNEIISALEGGEKTAYELAPCISWDVDFGSWELFPPAQKWFAFGETLAHAKHLEKKEMIQSKHRGDKIVFSLK